MTVLSYIKPFVLNYIRRNNFAGEEPCYAGVPMSSIVEQGLGVGDVISLLWFKRSLPRYCTQFIEVINRHYKASIFMLDSSEELIHL